MPLIPHPRYIPQERWTLDGQHGTTQLEVTIDATDDFLDAREWKGEPLFREWLFQEVAELNARILGIRKMTRREVAEMSGLPVYSMLEYQRLCADGWARASIEASSPLQAFAGVIRLKNR